MWLGSAAFVAGKVHSTICVSDEDVHVWVCVCVCVLWLVEAAAAHKTSGPGIISPIELTPR